MTILEAEPSDAQTLSEITKLSKAYWGYTPEQIQLWDEDLSLTPAYINTYSVYILRKDHQIIGYYSYFKLTAQTVKLDNLFLLPKCIGKGLGKKLMQDFLKRAKIEGYTKVSLDADPHAEGFYMQLGFEVVGKKETSIPNRFLPIMEKHI